MRMFLVIFMALMMSCSSKTSNVPLITEPKTLPQVSLTNSPVKGTSHVDDLLYHTYEGHKYSDGKYVNKSGYSAEVAEQGFVLYDLYVPYDSYSMVIEKTGSAWICLPDWGAKHWTFLSPDESGDITIENTEKYTNNDRLVFALYFWDNPGRVDRISVYYSRVVTDATSDAIIHGASNRLTITDNSIMKINATYPPDNVWGEDFHLPYDGELIYPYGSSNVNQIIHFGNTEGMLETFIYSIDYDMNGGEITSVTGTGPFKVDRIVPYAVESFGHGGMTVLGWSDESNELRIYYSADFFGSYWRNVTSGDLMYEVVGNVEPERIISSFRGTNHYILYQDVMNEYRLIDDDRWNFAVEIELPEEFQCDEAQLYMNSYGAPPFPPRIAIMYRTGTDLFSTTRVYDSGWRWTDPELIVTGIKEFCLKTQSSISQDNRLVYIDYNDDMYFMYTNYWNVEDWGYPYFVDSGASNPGVFSIGTNLPKFTELVKGLTYQKDDQLFILKFKTPFP